MFNTSWQNAVEFVTPYVIRIYTPQGSGTGFLLNQTNDGGIVGIATAAHVINYAHSWDQPIRLDHPYSGTSVMLKPEDRHILIDSGRDTAVILLFNHEITFQGTPLPLFPDGQYLPLGNQIGWLGYPAVAQNELCFFTGTVSHYRHSQEAYLVDGVAINGVSGGPTFVLLNDVPTIIGVVTAYIANRSTGEALPGMSVVQDVTQFQNLVHEFRTIDEANALQTIQNPPPYLTDGTDGE